MNSKERLVQLKGTLQQMISDLDDTYYSMKSELEDEILQQKERIEKIDKETNKIYYKLTHEVCESLIRTKLPLRVKLFNKIEYQGKGIEQNGYIRVCFSFNNNNCFNYIFSINEIKRLLKIKDGD